MRPFVSAMFLYAIVILFAIEANAYTMIKQLDNDPSSPNECVIRDVTDTGESEERHSVGTSWQTGRCEESSCIKRDGQLFVSTFGCGTGRVDLPCKMLPVDYAKPYPECCPKPWCPEGDSIDDIDESGSEE